MITLHSLDQSYWKRSILLLILCLFYSIFSFAQNDFEHARSALLEEINQNFSDTKRQTRIGALSESVYSALMRTPRHRFVPPDLIQKAYLNRPLPIGYGQTISQPFIVALMTELLEVESDHKVLEIGTGSGYQAAVLSEIVDNVYSIEIVDALGIQVAQRFTDLGYTNITTHIGDGYYGWEEYAPFDRIIVTAAASHIPPPLVEQLKPGGVMIIPVGNQFMTQFLVLVKKDLNGEIIAQQILPVSFVPLTGSERTE